jgi:hypothetical protein
MADVEKTVRAGYLATLRLWATGEVPGAEQLRRFRANGATRAAEGRPLPVVLRAYRVSGLAVFDYIVGRCKPPLDADEERNLARLTMIFIDQLSNEVTIGYVETSGQLANQQGRARRELLEDLLTGRLSAVSELPERAATLGLELPRRPSLLVAAPAPGDGATLVDRVQPVVREIARDRPGPPLHLLTRGLLVVIDDAFDVQAVRRGLQHAGLVGVVLDVADLAGVASAYQDARDVHEFLRDGRMPPTPLVDAAEAPLLALLARARRTEAAGHAARAILGDLLLPQHAALLDTLDAYLRAGNAVSAAHLLGVHPQTMRYRLKRLRQITGRDPVQGRDRFLLELALRLSPRRV